VITIRRKVLFARRGRGRLVIAEAPAQADAAPAGRVPRISRLMALAIHFDRLLREGKVANQSELARLAHVSQPRMTQIMNLNLLAPDIQEQLLFLPARQKGRDVVHEKAFRAVACVWEWASQRQRWNKRISSPELLKSRR
jgi:predicted XRE-type DNA-binding protein